MSRNRWWELRRGGNGTESNAERGVVRVAQTTSAGGKKKILEARESVGLCVLTDVKKVRGGKMIQGSGKRIFGEGQKKTGRQEEWWGKRGTFTP